MGAHNKVLHPTLFSYSTHYICYVCFCTHDKDKNVFTESSKQTSLEAYLKQKEEACREAEHRRVEVELRLVEVKENLRKSEAGPFTLGTTVDSSVLDCHLVSVFNMDLIKITFFCHNNINIYFFKLFSVNGINGKCFFFINKKTFYYLWSIFFALY